MSKRFRQISRLGAAITAATALTVALYEQNALAAYVGAFAFVAMWLVDALFTYRVSKLYRQGIEVKIEKDGLLDYLSYALILPIWISGFLLAEKNSQVAALIIVWGPIIAHLAHGAIVENVAKVPLSMDRYSGEYRIWRPGKGKRRF